MDLDVRHNGLSYFEQAERAARVDGLRANSLTNPENVYTSYSTMDQPLP